MSRALGAIAARTVGRTLCLRPYAFTTTDGRRFTARYDHVSSFVVVVRVTGAGMVVRLCETGETVAGVTSEDVDYWHDG